MCGIVGYIGNRQASSILLDGLRRLEYRGYDSAGVALCGASGLHIVKKAGRIDNLRLAVDEAKPDRFGICRSTTGRGQPTRLRPGCRRGSGIIRHHSGLPPAAARHWPGRRRRKVYIETIDFSCAARRKFCLN
jgi:hypothetical protein